jgi:hypothetical protein
MKKTTTLLLFIVLSSIAFSQQPSNDTVLIFVNKIKPGAENAYFVFKREDMVNCMFTNGKFLSGSLGKISSSYITIKKNTYKYSELSVLSKFSAIPGSNQYSFTKMHYKVLPESEIQQYMKSIENDSAIRTYKEVLKEINSEVALRRDEILKERKAIVKQKKEDKFFKYFGNNRQNKIKIWFPNIFINEFFASYEMRINFHSSFEVGAGYIYDYGNYINTKIHTYNFINGDDFNHSTFGRKGFVTRGSYMHYGYKDLYIGALAYYKYTQNGNQMVKTETTTRYANYWINQSEKSHIFGVDLLMGKQFTILGRASIDVFIAPGIKIRHGNIIIDGKYRQNTDYHDSMYYLEGNYPIYKTITKVYPDLQFGIKLGFAFGKKYNDYMKKPL